MSELDDKLKELVDYCAESYYPEHEYGAMWREQNHEYRDDAVKEIKQAFAGAGYYRIDDFKLNGKPAAPMTGQEWYERFLAEYHMRADWISADETMGEDAEHDVLNAAKHAAGIE